jgi:hypothetical protein
MINPSHRCHLETRRALQRLRARGGRVTYPLTFPPHPVRRAPAGRRRAHSASAWPHVMRRSSLTAARPSAYPPGSRQGRFDCPFRCRGRVGHRAFHGTSQKVAQRPLAVRSSRGSP